MTFSRILNFVFTIFIEKMCVVALALAVMIINGSTFHYVFIILSISGWYSSIFVVIVFGKNLSLQYVNLMNCILRLLLRAIEGFDWFSSLLIHMMFSLYYAIITSLVSTCAMK